MSTETTNGQPKRPLGNPNLDMTLWDGIDNPYHWPIFARNFNQKYNGAVIGVAPVKDDPMTRAKKVREVPMREDDVILAAFPKCGTHWLAEIMSMLVKGSTTYNKTGKENTMIEFVDDLSTMEDLPTPRMFNSHLYFALLPEQVVEKKVKIVHVIRNPKDTAVSWFHHVKSFPRTSTDFTFENFLKGYIDADYTTYGHQFGYLRQMAEFEKAHPDHPIIHVYYEDLKQNPIPVVQKVAKFLGLEASEDFCKDVVEACGFKNLKKVEKSRTSEESDNPPTVIYRKGIVGDWKNSFTVAQNEAFEEFIKEQQKEGFGNFKLNL